MGRIIRNGFLKTEDWLAVWLGFFVIAAILIGARPQMPTFKWSTEEEFKTTLSQSRPVVEQLIRDAEAKGELTILPAATALKAALDAGDRLAIESTAKKFGEAMKKVEDPGLKKKGGDLGKKLSGGAGALASRHGVPMGQRLGGTPRSGYNRPPQISFQAQSLLHSQ